MRAGVMESVGKYVDEVWEDVVSDISALVAHPSVADATAAKPGAPFGDAVRDALDCGLAIAGRLGYETGDDEGYVGFADIPGERPGQLATIAHVDVVPAGPGWSTDPYTRLGYETGDDEGYVGFADIPGERPGQLATIAHVDVVPAGPGWSTDPYTLERRDGWLLGRLATIAHVDVVPAGPGWSTDPYTLERRDGWLLGRGVIDDKGPAVLSLYAGAYLLRAGITPRYTFRALIGCDEEAGMTDVHHYLEGHEQPLFLFTPDAEFPVCNAEKGCFGGTFTSAPIEDGAIVSWSGAEATNAIPSESVCVLAASRAALPAPQAHSDRISLENAGEGRTRVFAQGIGGHASLPEGTLNAIALVVGYLREVAEACPDLFDPAELSFLDLLSVVHDGTAGEGLGIEAESEAFGPLTCNAGTIEVAEGRIFQTIDVRFPDTIACDEMSMIAGEGRTRVFAQGIGGHASLPEGTLNAIALVVGYLREVAEACPDLFDPAELSFLDLLSVVHDGTAGEGLGIEAESEAFGPLTCNAGTIEVAEGRIFQTIDVRFPDTIACDEMSMICRAHASRYGAEVAPGRSKEPVTVSADSPAVEGLLNTYREVTGKPAEPFSMGGGTYARNFASAVSFGPEDNGLERPAWAGSMHGPNEAANEALLRDALKMYILAILRLNELEL